MIPEHEQQRDDKVDAVLDDAMRFGAALGSFFNGTSITDKFADRVNHHASNAAFHAAQEVYRQEILRIINEYEETTQEG